MGWLDYHLHEFRVLDTNEQRVVSIGIPTDDDSEDHPVIPRWEVHLSRFFGQRGWHEPHASYAYDFGDDWEHVIVHEWMESAESGHAYPRCVSGARRCPPEDCGGIHGYAEFLEAIADPNHAAAVLPAALPAFGARAAGTIDSWPSRARGVDSAHAAADAEWPSGPRTWSMLNIHLHALVLDGVFTNDGGRVRFHPVRRLTREDVAEVLALIVRRVTRLIERRGLAGRAGPGRSGGRVRRRAGSARGAGGRACPPCGDPPEYVRPATLGPCHARASGFVCARGSSSKPASGSVGAAQSVHVAAAPRAGAAAHDW